jgi:hypothetical protein
MKNMIHYLKFIFVLTFLFACSKDKDDAPAAVTPPNAFIGKYALTAFNTGEPTDLNGDGTKNTNQLLEDKNGCYKNTFLTINADNTFVVNDKGLEIVFDGTTEKVGCYDDGEFKGTWNLKDNTLILKVPSNTSENIFTIDQNKLIYKLPKESIVGSGTNNELVTITTSVEYVYTKV